MAGQKSFRRKYNKIRHQFKGLYDTNLQLHEEEQRLVNVSRRLQEQNDQLLEILLDINGSERVAKHLRYALTTPIKESNTTELQAEEEIAKAEHLLEDARQQVASGDLMQRDYDILVAELKASLRKQASVAALPQMEKTISHTSLSLLREDQIPDDIKDEDFSTYLDALHEDTYLAQLDATIEGTQANGESQPQKPVLSEATLKNPVSTYNWLRENKPEVFVQEAGAADKEKVEEKETKGGSSTPATIKRESRAVKRTSVAELLDDDGNLLGTYAEPGNGSKSKRKRDDDAYRPKGGGSSKRRKKSSGKLPDAE